MDMNELLDLQVAPVRGALSAELGRALTVEDLGLLAAGGLGVDPVPLRKVRAQHHEIARLLASGARPVEVSAVLGVCQSRISILKGDPAFEELIEFYRGQEELRLVGIAGRAKLLVADAMSEIHERVVDAPEKISTKTLLDITTAMMDRTGHGPVQKSLHLGAVLTKDELEQIKNATRENSVVQRDTGAGVGGAVGEGALAEREVSGSQGEGDLFPTEGGEVITLKSLLGGDSE